MTNKESVPIYIRVSSEGRILPCDATPGLQAYRRARGLRARGNSERRCMRIIYLIVIMFLIVSLHSFSAEAGSNRLTLAGEKAVELGYKHETVSEKLHAKVNADCRECYSIADSIENQFTKDIIEANNHFSMIMEKLDYTDYENAMATAIEWHNDAIEALQNQLLAQVAEFDQGSVCGKCRTTLPYKTRGYRTDENRVCPNCGKVIRRVGDKFNYMPEPQKYWDTPSNLPTNTNIEKEMANFEFTEYDLLFPIDYGRVSSGFGSRSQPVDPRTGKKGSSYHAGVDIGDGMGGKTLDKIPVYAPCDGTIGYIGDNTKGIGYAIGINGRDRNNGEPIPYNFRMGHLSSYSKDWQYGDRVSRGEIIGYVGNTGTGTSPHLHFEVHDKPLTSAGGSQNTIDPGLLFNADQAHYPSYCTCKN